MKVELDMGAKMPTRAHGTDAGLDLYCREDATVWANCRKIFDTGVHIELPPGTYGKIESKSGLNVKYGIVSCGGVVDEGYTGSIKVVLYNFSATNYVFHEGDKIAQLIIMPCLYEPVELGEISQDTDRGAAGFGSTGR